MITVCYAAKGGSGTTVVVAAAALATDAPTLVVDLAGDLPATLGVADPDGPGVLDWMRSDAAPERLHALVRPVGDGIHLLHRGTAGPVPAPRWGALAAWLATDGRSVVVDAGTGAPPVALVAAGRAVLVTRACYLALRAAARMPARPAAVVLVSEPGRALGVDHVEAAVGAPVIATVLDDPAIARCVDAGLLTSRLPAGARRTLRDVA